MLELKSLSKAFFIVVFVSLMLTSIEVLIMCFLLPSDALEIKSVTCGGSKSLINLFARRWDGTCDGWTNELARKDIIADLKHLYSYIAISVAVLLFHPINKSSWISRVTVILTALFIFGCGQTHALDAYTTIHPIYNVSVELKSINGNISIIANFFVIYGLLRTVIVVNRRKSRLAELEKNLKT